ncbi:hypothetical protein [Pediococcus damnosus]|uniref:hypothetical protein n=1 Tax=Pediococcus damnosus TaxID=51663 RepID=UPI000C1C9C9D|nr:hypothetical protein [Pediococcus damnosus]PIO85904.1 hypothetical protein BSQ37_08120 [Pediococcus damnosus]
MLPPLTPAATPDLLPLTPVEPGPATPVLLPSTLPEPLPLPLTLEPLLASALATHVTSAILLNKLIISVMYP